MNIINALKRLWHRTSKPVIYTDCIFDLYGTLIDIRTDEEDPVLWQTLAAEYSEYGITSDPLLLKQQYAKLVEEEIMRMNCMEGVRRHGRYEAQRISADMPYEPEIDLTRVFAQLFQLGEKESADGEAAVEGEFKIHNESSESGAVTRTDISPDVPIIWEFGRRFRELSMVHISLYEGVREMLMKLKANGKRVWLLSNAQRVFTALELDQLGLTDCFDGIYLSSDYGCKKPDPAFFQILIRDRGIDPNRAIMIGNDGRCDMAGARLVGLHTLYMKSTTSPVDDDPDADYKLSDPDMKMVQDILLNQRKSC